jgi:hypothetical protein
MPIPLSSLASYATGVVDEDEDELLDQFAELPTDEVRALAAERWATCRSGSLALAFAERLAQRTAFLEAAIACARFALPARSTQEPALERSLHVAASCARGAATVEEARDAAKAAWSTVSRHVAGVDDDVGLAVMEACELVAGEPLDRGGTDPAYRAAWAWAWRRCGDGAARADVEEVDRQVHLELAVLVRSLVTITT